jgi:hypothetical protein
VSRFWRRAWPAFYRLIRVFEPVTLRLTRRFGLGDTVELAVRRRSGTARPILLGLLRVRGDWYVGHPNGECGWTRDLDRSPEAVVSAAWLRPTTVRAVLLPAGEERSDAIGATFRQHPFPGNVLYWLARRHIRAVGRYYRLDLVPDAADAAIVSGGGNARAAR